MSDKEKQGKRKIQIFEYLENEEIFLDELGKGNLIFVVLVWKILIFSKWIIFLTEPDLNDTKKTILKHN